MSRSPRIMGDTRREREVKVKHAFGPIRTLAKQIQANAVDSVRGEPVLLAWGGVMSAAHSLEGFGACFQRIAPDHDLSIYLKVSRKLHNGVPIQISEVDALEKALDDSEAIYRVTPLKNLKEAILTEQIAIELDALSAQIEDGRKAA